jgi:hypothetical protein
MSTLDVTFWSAVTCHRFGSWKRSSPTHFSNQRLRAEGESDDKSPHSKLGLQPTWHAGTVLFGSSDGWVYCLRADGGALA